MSEFLCTGYRVRSFIFVNQAQIAVCQLGSAVQRARPADPTEKVCRPQGSNLGPLRCQPCVIPTHYAGAKKVPAAGGPSTSRASACR